MALIGQYESYYESVYGPSTFHGHSDYGKAHEAIVIRDKRIKELEGRIREVISYMTPGRSLHLGRARDVLLAALAGKRDEAEPPISERET